MVNVSNFQEIANQIEIELIRLDNLREEILLLSRQIIRLSGQSIENFHRNKGNQSKEKLSQAESKMKKIKDYIDKGFHYNQLNITNVAMQEYAEAKLFYELIINQKLLSIDEVGVPEQAYLLGIADLIGEIRRYILEKLVEGDINKAKDLYEVMKEIYGTILQIEYGKNLISDFRRKKDTARILVERTLSDLFVATQSRNFQKNLNE
ncbi:MAG: haloacid dehalogenase [Candidatus Thorarchaeota archaeon]